MGLANIDSGLDDDQIQSLVHQLRHEFNDHHQPDQGATESAAAGPQGAWDRFRNTTATRITAHPELRPQRRAGLLRRITQADAPPPADMVYAAEHIRDRAIRAARLIDDHLATEAARIGVPDHDALNTYQEGRNDAPTGRQARATEEHRRAWPGLPLDPRTRHGLTALAARPDNPDGRHELIPAHNRVSAEDTRVVDAIGYHPGSGRLEILTPEQAVLTYRRIPPALAEQLRTGNDPDRVFRDRIQGHSGYQYRDAVQSAAAGVRRRCPDCGQFTGATHSCLGRRGGIRAGALGAVTPFIPSRRHAIPLTGSDGTELFARAAPLTQVIERLEQVRDEAVEFPVDCTLPGDRQVTGDLSAALDADDHISVNTARLACTCQGYLPGQGCPHIQDISGGLRVALGEQLQANRARVAAATAAAISPPVGGASTAPVTDTLLPNAPSQVTFSYTQDPARFADDVRAAVNRPAGQQVPWVAPDGQTPAMYGYGADRDFGIELEFDARTRPPALGDLAIDQRINYRYQNSSVYGGPSLVVGRVGRALYEAEFTPTDRQAGYHASSNGGYHRSLRRGWTFEHDSTVNGGELVSPILSNTTETWQRLHQACVIITDHGGRASERTGSHVTISAAEQAGQAVRLSRFLGLLHHHQRDLHVMAGAGHRRGWNYANPMPTPPDQGYSTITHARRSLDRYQFANINHVATSRHDRNANSSRIEFRLWDGSLEAGRIQGQIKMSAALLDYATRNRGLTFDHDDRAEGVALNPDATDFADHTRQIRRLIDHLFRRDIDRQQAAALWAAGLDARNFVREHV